jgi:hypothetical protein
MTPNLCPVHIWTDKIKPLEMIALQQLFMLYLDEVDFV